MFVSESQIYDSGWRAKLGYKQMDLLGGIEDSECVGCCHTGYVEVEEGRERMRLKALVDGCFIACP